MLHFFKPENNRKRTIVALVAIFFITCSTLAASYLYWEKEYENRIYPGVFLGDIDLGGLDKPSAKKLINERIDRFKEKGLMIRFHKHEARFLPLVSNLDADVAYELVSFMPDMTLEKIMAFGRTGNFFARNADKLQARQKRTIFKIDGTVNHKKIREFLVDNFAEFSQPAIDAKLTYVPGDGAKPTVFGVTEEKYGELIEYEKGQQKLIENFAYLDFSDLELSASVNFPRILRKDILNIDAKANQALREAPFTLKYENQAWEISQRQLLPWLALKESGQEAGNDRYFVGLDFEKTEKYLTDAIAPLINIEPIDAKFEIKDGRVIEFQVARDGKKIDIIKTFTRLENRLREGLGEDKSIEVVVVDKKSELKAAEIDNMGIKEIIGTGHSNFAGSPKNRRHNIAVGAASVNGTIIKPGEEFSLIKTLGDIDKEAGYLPELVIKENKTTPEYGGGLCQIGTTVFRATLASGLPVTERRNHSYRVSYYEPAGTDATIYDPWPDYRFKNDTPYSILIQSRIEGDDLYFDFWSTEDGRTATSTYPTIYNIVKPGPTKIIESADLKPGEKKCTEKPHNGADAWFDYTIIYSKANPSEKIKTAQNAGTEIKEEDYTEKKRFYSHYVPWREVCLIGIDPASSKSSATSSPEASN